MSVCVYKVTINIKHPVHGWLKLGRFVKCRPEYAKNHVIRRELVRVSSEKLDSLNPLWIDSIEEPKVSDKKPVVSNEKPKVVKKQRKKVNAKTSL